MLWQWVQGKVEDAQDVYSFVLIMSLLNVQRKPNSQWP